MLTDIRPGHHDGADQGVAEVEDRLDHLRFVVLDHVRFRGPVDEFAEFLFAEERLVVRRGARGDGAAERDEPARNGPEDPA